MESKENKKPRNPKAKKPFNKGKRNWSKDDSSKVQKDIHNDPSWYTVNGQLLKDVSSFNFNNALGARITLGLSKWGAFGTAYTTAIPGIMSMLTMPTVGTAVSAEDPINIAAKNIYSYVRHANSGHSNYDPADLMLYFLSMDSIYIYWSWMVRLYGTANIFSQTNRYIGDALIKAQGGDPENLRSNLADFRAYINMFAVKASAFAVPKTMTYFVRHSWMYSNIYKDEDVAKAQMYLYDPAYLYKYQIDSTTGAGMLKHIPVCVLENGSGSFTNFASLKLADIMAKGNELLNAIIAQEDIGIMSGDVLKAYGSENLWRLMPIPENYGVLPVFSEEVLMQIHNTEFASPIPIVKNAENAWVASSDCLDVTQTTGVGEGNLIFSPIFQYANHLMYDKILDFWKEEVTPEMCMVSSRNKLAAMAAVGSAASDYAAEIVSCGSELAFCAYVWGYNASGVLEANQMYHRDNIASDYDQVFNEHPIQYQLVTNRNAISRIRGELDNYAVLDQDNIRNMHTTALLSMLGVPYIK